MWNKCSRWGMILLTSAHFGKFNITLTQTHCQWDTFLGLPLRVICIRMHTCICEYIFAYVFKYVYMSCTYQGQTTMDLQLWVTMGSTSRWLLWNSASPVLVFKPEQRSRPLVWQTTLDWMCSRLLSSPPPSREDTPVFEGSDARPPFLCRWSQQAAVSVNWSDEV